MKTRRKAPGEATAHTKEIYGVTFLAVGVFLMLCLFSYDAMDSSLTTLSVGKKIHNLGGIVGSYLADFLFTLTGYGGYLVPFAFLGIAVTHFALKDLKLGLRHYASYTSLIFLSAIFSHLKFHEVYLGGRAVDAGGVAGWWLGGHMVRFFGITGAYLLIVSGIVLTLIAITRITLLRTAKVAQGVGLVMFQRLGHWMGTFFVVGWARAKRDIGKMAGRLGAWRQSRRRKRSEPLVRRPMMASSSAEVSTPSSPTRRVSAALAPLPFSQPHDPMPSIGGSEPKILPRVDLKEDKRRDQMELIPVVAANYQLPQLAFLDSESQEIIKIDEEGLKLNSRLLEKKLLDYGVEGRITEIHPGPIITMYEFEPAAGVKVNKIVNLEDDLALTMGGKSVRIIAPLPGKPAVGIEIPNNDRETVWLKEIIGHTKFQKADSKLTLALGKDTEGIPFVADLAKMPHLLVAGATGAGKSVAVNSMILSIIYKATPEEVRAVFIDMKMLELSIYEGIPHLLMPVVTNPKKASLALRWAVHEMERRYEILAQKGSRNIGGYNKAVVKEERLPYIMIVIDELADLMMTAAKDVETSVTRLAQMARAAGLHLILATQRPSVDVLTGLIKANFPARISFKVTSKHDSRTIIDTVGAEHLLGSGDMLYMSGGTSKLLRVHGAYVSETEILRVVDHWKKQGKPRYLDESVLKPMEEELQKEEGGEDLSDELYDQGVALVTETRQASISMIQRRLRIGYNRAARMIERMEKEGIVGPADGARPREVYASGSFTTPSSLGS